MEHLCILSPEQCKHQVSKPTEGGRHVAVCTCPDMNCPYHAEEFLPQKKENDEISNWIAKMVVNEEKSNLL